MQKYHPRIFSSLYWVLSWIKSRSRVRHLGACGQMKHMTIVKDWKAERGTLNCHYFGPNCLPMTFSARECRKEAWKKTNINMRSQKDFPLSRGKKHFSFLNLQKLWEKHLWSRWKPFLLLTSYLIRKGFQLVWLDINHQPVLSVTTISIRSCTANGIQAPFTDTLIVFKISTRKLTHIT